MAPSLWQQEHSLQMHKSATPAWQALAGPWWRGKCSGERMYSPELAAHLSSFSSGASPLLHLFCSGAQASGPFSRCLLSGMIFSPFNLSHWRLTRQGPPVRACKIHGGCAWPCKQSSELQWQFLYAVDTCVPFIDDFPHGFASWSLRISSFCQVSLLCSQYRYISAECYLLSLP